MNNQVEAGRLIPNTGCHGTKQGLDAASESQAAINEMLSSISDADLKDSIRKIFDDLNWMADVFTDCEINLECQQEESNLDHHHQLPPAAVAIAA